MAITKEQEAKEKLDKAFKEAVDKGNLKKIQDLIKEGANVQKYLSYCLSRSAYWHHQEVFDFLLTLVQDLPEKVKANFFDDTLIHCLRATPVNLGVIKQLDALGVNLFFDYGKMLREAGSNEDVETTKFLLNHPKRLNMDLNANQAWLLVSVAGCNAKSILPILIHAGANIELALNHPKLSELGRSNLKVYETIFKEQKELEIFAQKVNQQKAKSLKL